MTHLRRNIALFAIALALCAGMAAFAPARAIFGKSRTPATVEAFAKSDRLGQLICFSPEDFTDRVNGKDILTGMIVETLPQTGVLRLAGQDVAAGEQIDIGRLGALCFVPEIGRDTHTAVTFRPVFARGGEGDPVTVSLNLSDTLNDPPVAVMQAAETYADLPLTGTLKAVDPEGDTCTFEIIAQGKKGQAAVEGNVFTYLPVGKPGKDRFTFVATDVYGNRSQPATVTVTLIKRAARERFSYTDMKDSPAHYAAVRLREAGVFSGESIGASAFFQPEKPVTRAEFLAMAASIADLPMPTAAVSTGLADDGDIPAWAQGYVVAGLTGGVIRGVSDGAGNRVFQGNVPITRAEAAVLLDRALHLPNDGRELTASDASNIPQWAKRSVVNTASTGILPVFSDDTLRVSEAVTREDAAVMLYEALRYRLGE